MSLVRKIQIALEMGVYSKPIEPYKSNTLFCGKPCMVTSSRAFKILEDGSIMENQPYRYALSSTNYQFDTKTDVTVYDIAFDLPSNTKGTPTRMLWFNLPCDALTHLPSNTRPGPSSISVETLLKTYDNFCLVPTSTETEMNLARDILHNRLNMLKYQFCANNDDSYIEWKRLASRFNAIRFHLNRWSWPKRQIIVDGSKHEPRACMEYQPNFGSNGNSVYTNAGSVWDGFVTVSEKAEGNGMTPRKHCFPTLLQDKEIEAEGVSYSSGPTFKTKNIESDHRPERCWQSLLLHDGPNDWDLIIDKFSSKNYIC